jgi:hypothetical protein
MMLLKQNTKNMLKKYGIYFLILLFICIGSLFIVFQRKSSQVSPPNTNTSVTKINEEKETDDNVYLNKEYGFSFRYGSDLQVKEIKPINDQEKQQYGYELLVWIISPTDGSISIEVKNNDSITQDILALSSVINNDQEWKLEEFPEMTHPYTKYYYLGKKNVFVFSHGSVKQDINDLPYLGQQYLKYAQSVFETLKIED